MKNREIYRIIDANFNRAKEGLRVAEDFARFVICDEKISSEIKNQRHLIDKIARTVYPSLILARDSRSDIFRETKETGKRDGSAVAVSNIKRAEESLRTLEEFSKIISAAAGSKFKKIRFKIYDIEKEIAGKIV